jgi:hypothetical protein
MVDWRHVHVIARRVSYRVLGVFGSPGSVLREVEETRMIRRN